ncbi:MAG: sugar ABC transporter permease [Chloroflexi bacterium]|nr:sugar ABC transporter permease [Chloroflexota bacterium]
MAQHTTRLVPDKPARPALLSAEGLRYLLARPSTREALVAYVFLTPFFIFFIVFVLRAIVQAGYMSLHDWKVLGTTQKFIGLQNYTELLNDDVWWIALKNTAVFAALTVAGTTALSLGLALILRRNLRGTNFFRSAFYAPSILSVGIVAICWGWLMNTDFGVINYALRSLGLRPINWTGDAAVVIPALSLVTIWWGFGFPMLIMLAGLQNIPEQLYEAARIDGANPRQVFWYITLPLLRPTLLFVTVTGFIAHFQVFGQPYFMTNSGGPGRASYTVILYLYEAAWEAFRMGFASSVAFTLAIILMIITLIQFFFIGRRVEY